MKCVIIGASEIDLSVKQYIDKDDFIIACDGGLVGAKKLNVTPSLIVGDFDSHKKPETDIETIVLPCEKDDTDTVFAIKEALSRGYKDFVMLGVTGGRFDHTLCNVYSLLMLKNAGADGLIADGECEIRLVDKSIRVPDKYKYFSLVAINDKATGVSITGAKYPLENACIEPHYQYGISNEVSGGFAEVSVKDGQLLLICIK